jgi:hypothetical protein
MTKFIVTISLALVAASFASAADITLKDGRVLRDAVVIRHDAATVTFRHTTGFTQIERSKLPEVLAAEYPLDPTQAKLESDQQRQEALARRAEAERLCALRVQLAATAPKPAQAPAYEEPEQDTTSTTSWIDTYNTESWRLMRARAHDHDRTHRSGSDNCSHHDGTRPTPQSAPAARVTSDIHMPPDVRMMGLDEPQSSTVQPNTFTDQ